MEQLWVTQGRRQTTRLHRLPYALTTGGRAAAAYVKGTSTLTHAEEVDEQNAIWQSVESELSDPKPKSSEQDSQYAENGG